MAGGAGGGGAPGGTGYTGQAGQPGGVNTEGGGGGGGAGGGIGVTGGAGGVGGGIGGGAGGKGGTSASPNGTAGGAGIGGSGGGGGGGGYLGYIGAGTSALALTNVTFVGGNGGAGGASGPADSNGGGGGGGAGGYGAVVTGTMVPVATTVQGGTGGVGGSSSIGAQGTSGDGGVGLLSTAASATITNESMGKIVGGAGGAADNSLNGGVAGSGGVGLVLQGKTGTVSNMGAVTGGTGGVGTMPAGFAGAGGVGIVVSGSGGTVSNTGTVTGGTGGSTSDIRAGGVGGAGIDFTAGGATLINQSSAIIFGGAGGTATIAASGAGGVGVVFADGGTLTNYGGIEGGATSTAGVPGGAGVTGAGLTIIDTGTIAGGIGGSGGSEGDAITFTGGANTLALGATTNSSTPLYGALDIQAGTLKFDQNAGTDLPTNTEVSPVSSIIGLGAVIKADAGTLTLGNNDTYSGGTTINAGTLDLAALGAAGTGAITFAPTTGSTATLALEPQAQPGNGQTFGNTLANFGASDQLDLETLAYNPSSAGAQYNPATGKLMVTEGDETEDFNLTGVVSGETFSTSSDGSLGTKITAMVCFATGTHIRTARGDVSVEALQAGDLAVTASGTLRPIRWIGQRTIDCAAHPVPSEAWPVRVLAGAFGADLPERDLYLSPGHPVLVGHGESEVLVPIMCLINGTSIARRPVAEITYWHVELDAHDILLAEGLPAESFLDWGNRPWFAGGADHALLHPDFVAPGLAGRCRPVAIDGAQVEAERRRIDTLFELRLAGQCAWPMADDGWDDRRV